MSVLNYSPTKYDDVVNAVRMENDGSQFTSNFMKVLIGLELEGMIKCQAGNELSLLSTMEYGIVHLALYLFVFMHCARETLVTFFNVRDAHF